MKNKENKKQCNHNLKRIYYRVKETGMEHQKWKTLDNKWFCTKCCEVIEIK